MDRESSRSPRPALAQALAQVDELDELEAERNALGAKFLRRNGALSLVAVSAILAGLPTALEYTPLEYGLPWFVIFIGVVLGWKSLGALASGLVRRREIEAELTALREPPRLDRVASDSQGASRDQV